MEMRFEEMQKKHRKLVYGWFKEPHVAEYWYGVGLQNTFEAIERFFERKEKIFTIWIAYDGKTPFAYLMTSTIDSKEYPRYCGTDANAISLDLLIGNSDYLGKGFGHVMIGAILRQQFPNATDVFIDPALANGRAIHVYEKAGFEKKEEFFPSWEPEAPHILMHMKR